MNKRVRVRLGRNNARKQISIAKSIDEIVGKSINCLAFFLIRVWLSDVLCCLFCFRSPFFVCQLFLVSDCRISLCLHGAVC